MNRPISLGVMGLSIGFVLMGGAVLAAGSFDGTYAGPRTQTKGETIGKCQNLGRDRTMLIVKDNVATYTWATGPINAPVQADGSFEGRAQGLAMAGASGSFILKGKITGPKLEADLGTTVCAVHLSLTKS